MAKTQTKKIAPPADKAEAAALLGRLGVLAGRQIALLTAAEEQIRTITATSVKACEPLQAELAAIRKALKKWADKHRDKIVDPGTKTVTLATGELTWRDGPEALELAEGWDQGGIIEALEDLQLVECIRQPAPELDKEQIKKLWPHLVEAGMKGLRLVQREFFQLKPISIAVPIEMKTKTVNVVDELDGKPRKERSK